MKVARLEFRDSLVGPAETFEMVTPAGLPFKTKCVLLIVFAELSHAQRKRFKELAGGTSRIVDPNTGVEYSCPDGGDIRAWVTPQHAATAFRTTEVDAVATAALKHLMVLLGR